MSLFDEITNRNANQNQIKKRDDEEQKSSMSLFDEITSGQNQIKKRDDEEQKSSMSLFDEITSGQNTSDDNFSTFDTKSTFDAPKKDLGSTVGYTTGKVATGATSVFEGLADTGAWLMKQIGKITSWMMDNPVGEFIFGKDAGDVESNPFYQIGSQMIEDEIVKTIDTKLDESKMAKQSYVEPGSLGANIASGVGQVGGMVLTGKIFPAGKVGTVASTASKGQKILNSAKIAISNPTTKSMFLSTFGNSYSQASNSGANDVDASLYGLLNAAKETTTEMIYGGLGAAFGKGALDDVAKEGIEKLIYSKLGETVKAKLLAKTSQLGISMFAEGMEEVLATLLNPFVESMYTKKLDFSSYNSILDDFITGALVSGVLETGSNVVNLRGKNPQEVATKLQQQSLQEKLDTISTQTNQIVDNKNIDNKTKIDRINNQLDILNDQLTQDAPIGTIDIQGIYNQKVELMKKRDKLIENTTEQQKIEIVNELSNQVTEVLNAPEGTVDTAIIEAANDKVQQIEKLTEEVEKDKKIKVLSNKQKIQLNGQQYINEAADIIEQMNMNIPEGQERIEIVTELNQEQRQVMDLASVFGKQVIFTENMPQSGAVSNRNPNILFIDNNINSKLITNNEGAMLYTMGHELFHSLKMSEPKIYNEFINYTKDSLTFEQIINFVERYDTTQANQILDSLKINGKFDLEQIVQNPSEHKVQSQALNNITEEIVANEFGGMITDKNYMNKLYEDNPSLFKKVIDAIRELFKSLNGSIYDSSLTQLQVEKIRNDFETIVKENQQKETKTKETVQPAVQKETVQQTKPIETKETVTKPIKLQNILEAKEKTVIKDVDGNVVDFYRLHKDAANMVEDYDYNQSSTSHVAGFGLELRNDDMYTKGRDEKDVIKTKLYTTKGMLQNDGQKIGFKRVERINKIANRYMETKDENYFGTEPIRSDVLIDAINQISNIIANNSDNATGRKAWVEFYDNIGKDGYIKTEPDGSLLAVVVSPKQLEYFNNVQKQKKKEAIEAKKPVLPKIEDTTPIKTSQMSLEDRYKGITRNYERYLKEKSVADKQTILNATLKMYQNYKKDGGTEVNVELDKLLENKNKVDFKDKLKQQGLNIKELPKAMPLSMRRQLFNREITIPEGMSLGEAINIYRKNPNNKRLLTRTIEPVEYAKDVTPSDIGKVLELNRVEVLNPEKIEWDRATRMFGKGMYFSLTKGTTRYYQYQYKDAKYLVDKYDVDTKDIFVLQLDQVYDDNNQYLPGRSRYDVSARDELSNAMIKQGILTEQERNEIKNKNNHFVQTYNEILKEKGYKGIAVFVHPTDSKNGEVTYFGGNQLVLFDTSKAIRKQSGGFVGKEYIKYLPKNTDEQQKESQFYTNTVTNSPLFKSIFDDLSKNKDFRYYSTVSHKGDFDKAVKNIQTNGDTAISEFLAKDNGFNSVDSAMAKIMIEYYQRTGDVQSEVVVATKIRKAITQGAQLTESAKIFKDLSPASVVVQIQNDITRAIEDLQTTNDPTIRIWLNENAAKANLTEAEREWVYQMAEKARKQTYDSPEYRRTYALIQAFVADRIPKSIASKVKAYRRMAMLFNPKTMVRNYGGNLMMQPVNRFSDAFGSKLDAFLAKETGIRTQGSVDKQAFKDGKRQGIAEAKEDMRLGINTSRTNPYEMQQGKTFKDKGAGKVLNWVERWMNYGLNRGDRGWEEAYYQNSLANQMRLNGVTEATETMKQIAQQEAEKKTWKNDGKMMRIATSARNLLNSAFRFTPQGVVVGKQVTESQYFGLGDLVLPFIMTPANLAVAIYDYSPAAALSVANNARKYKQSIKSGKDVAIAQKALVDSFGKASAGVLLYAIGYVLANAGFITGGEDEDKDVRATMRAQGYQPYSIKIGDLTFSYDWAQPLANPFATMAELHRQTEMNKNNPNKSDDANNAFKAISEAFTIGGDRLYEQSFLQSLKNLLSAESPKDGIIQFSTDLPQSFVPTLFKQVADMIDGTAKSTYDGNNLLTTMFAKAMVKIPFLKSTLPTKKDILGNDVQMYGGENNIFNVMFNPANVSRDIMGDIGNEITDVYNHTGENAVMPQVAVRYIDYDSNGDGIKERITFDNAQQAILQQYMGNTMASAMSEMLNNDVYQNASYEDKTTALISLMQYSKAIALRDTGLVPNYEIKTGNAAQIDKYVSQGLSIPNAVMYDSLINPIKGYKDANGDSVKGSENGQKAYAIMNMQISDDAKNVMLKLISPLSNTPETVDSLANLGTTQQFIDYYSLPRRDVFLMDKFSRDDYDISTTYFNIAGSTYTEFVGNVSQIKPDYDTKGNPIPNSKKGKVFRYINSLPLNQYQKLYLFSISGYSISQWKNQMFNYVNNMNVSANEKKAIWSSLGFE